MGFCPYFLHDHESDGGNASPACRGFEPTVTDTTRFCTGSRLYKKLYLVQNTQTQHLSAGNYEFLPSLRTGRRRRSQRWGGFQLAVTSAVLLGLPCIHNQKLR